MCTICHFLQSALKIKLDEIMLLIIDITVYLTVYRLRYYVIFQQSICAVNYQQNFKFQSTISHKGL